VHTTDAAGERGAAGPGDAEVGALGRAVGLGEGDSFGDGTALGDAAGLGLLGGLNRGV